MPRLRNIEPAPKLGHAEYKQLLRQWQHDLLSLQQTALRAGARMIVNIEGMDAAGKGGAIRRMVARLDPRGYKVYRIGAPEPWEEEHHYLYRFWTRLPRPGELVIFDRSWYGAFWSSASRASPARRNGSAPTTKSTNSNACWSTTA